MPYKNPKDFLADAPKFLAAVEARLPEGAPKIAPMLVDTAGKLPDLPDFPMEVPSLPAPPTLPETEAGGDRSHLPYGDEFQTVQDSG